MKKADRAPVIDARSSRNSEATGGRSQPKFSIFSWPDGDRDWAVSVYVGRETPVPLLDIVGQPWNFEFNDTWLAAATVSRQLFVVANHLSWEVEAGVGRRFGNDDLWEFHTAIGVRWDWFPWNKYLPTTIALFGVGPSYATKISPVERERSENNGGSKLLNFMAPEMTIELWRQGGRSVELIGRIHHRSGARFRLFNEARGGTNFSSIGIRSRF